MPNYFHLFFATLLLCLSAPSPLSAQDSERDPFRVSYDDRVRKVYAGDSFAFEVDFKIPKGFYLYDEKTSVLFDKTEDILVLKSDRPAPQEHDDPFLKKKTKVYFNDFRQVFYFLVPKDAAPGRRTLEAQLRYQGCSAEFCYRPIRKTIFLPVEVQRGGAIAPEKADGPAFAGPPPTVGKQPTFWQLIEETNPERLLDQGKIYLLGLAMVGGILTSFTPCVLPIIPLTLAFIGVRHRKRGNLFRAALLVLGMVSMYSFLGFLAASLGLKLGFLFQSRYFVLFTALFFLFLAMGLLGVIPFHLPSSLQSSLSRWGGEGPWGSFLAGLTVGLIASPCVGPLIAPLLLIAARGQDKLYGFALLFSYGLGMGLLFLILGSAYGSLAGKLKSGKWTQALKKTMAVLLLVPALYYAYVFAKPFLGKPRDALWVYRFEEGLSLAKQMGKPILLDYYADWCPPCIELDKRTFSTLEVRETAKQFVMLKIDCSTDDDNCQKATKAYEVVGWPSVLFLKSNGERIPDVQLIGGFADKKRMLQLMQEALEKAKK